MRQTSEDTERGVYWRDGEIETVGQASGLASCVVALDPDTGLPPGSGSGEFRATIADIVLPALSRFRPDFVLVSAGFDAHRADPLAALELVEDDYAWVTRAVMAAADECCTGRVVSTLEGGYDLAALAASAAAHVEALMAG